ncbi:MULTISPECIES: reverse transcriptase family protein [Leclercia]|uniref:reverse transcriptase family protein n=1 Tax=Leclercia TaxID=83654 RepID=UPI0013314A5F|nr:MULTISPECIES: reverse transcriptase family protein [Leclercia]
MNKPYYKKSPIASVEKLSLTLNVTPERLAVIVDNIHNSYKTFTKVTGRNKKERSLSEPKKGLKKLQKRINQEIFENVSFPDYLHGGLKGKDYLSNAKVHTNKKHLISLDIENFYPSISKKNVLEIFKYMMRFPEDVSKVLTELVTLDGHVPQGSCCSSYIANLVFFNTEYNYVNQLKNKGYHYTRLLDDITISSDKELDKKEKTFIINQMRAMVEKHRLKINDEKTKVESHTDLRSSFEVTGLWTKHKNPKLRKPQRRHIRYLVFICSKQAEYERTSNEYHALWNKVSGKVAQMQRIGHTQANQLREQLTKILPIYDDFKIKKVIYLADILSKTKKEEITFAKVERYRKIIHKLDIVSRSNKKLADKHRSVLHTIFKDCKVESE